jgi:hypothetical protein
VLHSNQWRLDDFELRGKLDAQRIQRDDERRSDHHRDRRS